MAAFFVSLVRSIAVAFVTLVTLVGSGMTGTTTPPYIQKQPVFTSEKKAESKIEISLPTTKEPATEKISVETPKNVLPVKTTQTPSIPTKEATEKVQGALNAIVKQIEALPTPVPLPSVSEVNDLARGASVNILCTTKSSGSLNPITGSGVIIDERGIILTNAHIAQYFLLKDFPIKDSVDCVIRIGSPAQPRYRAELIFISPSWIEKNSKSLTLENPLGTGENDFALLLITDTTNPNTPLPVSFNYLSPTIVELSEKNALSESYLISGYPAGFLGGIAVLKDLFISSTVVSAKQVFTFKETTLDLISLGGSILAQKGASGSAVVRQSDKKLIGIIVTTSDGATTGDRDLGAITTTHINRSLLVETGKGLLEFLDGDLQTKFLDFNTHYYQNLKNILVNELLN